MPAPFLRTPYNYDTNKASDESALRCKDKSLAKQSYADECDINVIAHRYGLTGELPQGVRMPTYGDFTGVFDFQTAMNQVISSQQSFAAMPASVRNRFDNDPGKFVEWCSQQENLEEAEKLGLISAQAHERLQQERATAKAEELAQEVEKALKTRDASPGTQKTET